MRFEGFISGSFLSFRGEILPFADERNHISDAEILFFCNGNEILIFILGAGNAVAFGILAPYRSIGGFQCGDTPFQDVAEVFCLANSQRGSILE